MSSWRRRSKENDLEQVDFYLKPFSELMINVDDAPQLELMVLDGIAEINGVILENNHKYCFGHSVTVFVFTYHGCNVAVFKNNPSKCMVSNETSMDALLNIHISLEEYRQEALKNNTSMPVTICVGDTPSGKQRGLETLFNYSLRQNPDEDRKIFFVDLNHSHNLLSVPGTLGVCILQNPPCVREGFLLNCKNPLIFSFEHSNPIDNILLYKYYICKLACFIKVKRELFPNIEVMIQIPSWLQGTCYKLLLKACQEFQVSHVVVFESAVAYNQLIEDLPPFVKVIHTPRILMAMPPARVRPLLDPLFEYFFGTQSNPLIPFRIEYTSDDVKLLCVEDPGLMGNKFKRPKLKMTVIDDNVTVRGKYRDLHRYIFSVFHVPENTARVQEDFYKFPALAYICILKIRGKSKLEVLSPLPRKSLPTPMYVSLMDMKLEQHLLRTELD